MYPTSVGKRVLTGKEAALFKELLLEVICWLDPRLAFVEIDEEAMNFGIDAFDRLSFGQKLWSLHQVAGALLLLQNPTPKLSAYVEATVATIFARAEMLLDLERLDNEPAPIRPLLKDAVKEVERKWADDDIEEIGYYGLADLLASRILWDDDYLSDGYSDQEPQTSAAVRDLLGIEDDYYIDIPHDPPASEYGRLYHELLLLCGDTPAGR